MTDQPERFTGSLFRRAQQLHAAAWAREVSTAITSVQWATLDFLSRVPGASQRELCDELAVDRSTVADLVARLERNGLIERNSDAVDRRRNLLRLTTAGTAELEQLRPGVEHVEGILTSALTVEERRELRRLLHVVLAAG